MDYSEYSDQTQYTIVLHRNTPLISHIYENHIQVQLINK